MDQQLKQRLIGASVVVALAVIIVPELVKQEPGDMPSNEVRDIPPRPSMEPQTGRVDALRSDSATMIVLPAGQTAQKQTPEQALAEQEVETLDEVLDALSAEPLAMEPVEPVMPPSQAREPLSPEGETAPPGQNALQPAEPKPIARVAAPEQTAQPQPQRVTPAEPIVSARPAPARPAAPANAPVKEPASAPARTQAGPAPAPASPPATPSAPKIDLPAINLIARSQYSGDTSQQTSREPRWMVQAGSFYVAENASTLREKLRQQRFPATLNSAVVDGRTVYRVQVGPHATRAEGERTKERLQREAGINGDIVPVYN